MKFAFLFFSALLLCAASTMSAQAATLISDSIQLYDFAEQLFQEGQYRRAAEEYQRFAFFSPQDPRRRNALFKAAQSFFQAGDYDSAAAQFRVLTAGEDLDSVAVESYFMLAECYLQMKIPGQASVTLLNLSTLSRDTAVRDRAFFRIGWIRIEQMDWSGAQQAFEHVSASGQKTFRIGELIAALQETGNIHQKSPLLAGILSILPGAGQLYCGRYEDALAAFAVNGGLMLAAYESFDNELYALGGLLAFVGVGFYAGNIFGAVGDAHKYNQIQRQRFVEQLKRRLTVSLGPAPQASTAGLLFKLQLSF